MPEEQRKILEMLASKQISVEQADRLLEAVSPVPVSNGGTDQERTGAYHHTHTHRPQRQPTTDGGAYLREMRALGLRDLAPHDLIALKSTGVEGAYVRDLRAQGVRTVEAHDLIALKSIGVDAAYIQDLRDAGLESLEVHDLVAFKSQDIDGAYIRRMRSAGFAELAPHDLIALKSQGIDAWEEGEDALSDEPRDQDAPNATPAGGDTVRLLSVGNDPDREPDADQS